MRWLAKNMIEILHILGDFRRYLYVITDLLQLVYHADKQQSGLLMVYLIIIVSFNCVSILQVHGRVSRVLPARVVFTSRP